MNNDAIRSAVLEAVKACLSSQIKAIRALRSGGAPQNQSRSTLLTRSLKGRSHVDMAYDMLAESHRPLHVANIISRIAARFDARVDRESLVSALSKRIARHDRFKPTGKNTFALIEGSKPPNIHD